jgi:hypothetical protein
MLAMIYYGTVPFDNIYFNGYKNVQVEYRSGSSSVIQDY